MAPRKAENNACAKFWGDKQRALWYVMVLNCRGQLNKRFYFSLRTSLISVVAQELPVSLKLKNFEFR